MSFDGARNCIKFVVMYLSLKVTRYRNSGKCNGRAVSAFW
jgi:hypothetical protein